MVQKESDDSGIGDAALGAVSRRGSLGRDEDARREKAALGLSLLAPIALSDLQA